MRNSTNTYQFIFRESVDKKFTNKLQTVNPSLHNFTHPPLNSDFLVLCPVIINPACIYREAELCLHRLGIVMPATSVSVAKGVGG
jgi:hypothetical protein